MNQSLAPRAVAFARVRLALTIALAALVASVWAARVPFFQQPDELAHADYAFELANVGRPFAVPRAAPGQVVTPQTRYLTRATRYRENRYATHVRMPPAYGSSAYFAQIDRAAPKPVSTVPAPGAVLPYEMFSYPVGYFSVVAIAMRLAASLHPGSISTCFFAARSIGVLCLIATLLSGYSIFLRLGVSRRTATIATFAIGLLPITSWVSGYVQPDVLTTLLVTASIAASLRWKAAPHKRIPALALALSLVSLAFVKEHYALATIAATGLTACCSRGAFRRARIIAPTFLLPLAAVYAAAHINPAEAVVTINFSAYRAGGTTVAQLLGNFAAFSLLGFRDVFAGGDPFVDFWFRFGYHPADAIFPGSIGRIARNVLVAPSLATLALFIASRRLVLGRLVGVARRRSPVAALRLLAGDPVINVYVFVTIILLSIYAYSNGFFWLEGRYWLPVIVPTLAIVTVRNVRVFKKPQTRRRVGFLFATAWAGYAAIGAPLGIAAIQRSFYTTPPPTEREPYAEILRALPEPGCAKEAESGTLAVRAGCAVRVSGFAIDGSRGLPAADVFLVVDGIRFARARAGLPSPRLASSYNDTALARSGFDAVLATAQLKPGRHTLGIAVIEADAPRGRSGPDAIPLEIVR